MLVSGMVPLPVNPQGLWGCFLASDSVKACQSCGLEGECQKYPFCGIKFSISESLEVTQVAVHTDGAQVQRPLQVLVEL